MKAVMVFSCLVAVTTAQFGPPQPHPSAGLPQRQPLREAIHLRQITEPHLPQDPNVLLATANFLEQFSQLKALADAAPDPLPTQRPRPVPVAAPAPHRFAAPAQRPQVLARPQPAAPRGVPQPVRSDFDVHGQISSLLSASHVANPSAPRQQFSSFGPRQQASVPAPPPRRFDPNIPITNEHGHIVNPLQYDGPLADQFPAAVGGEIRSLQFTPAVQAAQQALADAHRNILTLQAQKARENPQPQPRPQPRPQQQARFF